MKKDNNHITPPDYIIVTAKLDAVPEIEVSCNKGGLEGLKCIAREGQYIYKLVKGLQV
jgi:hypothetical protein